MKPTRYIVFLLLPTTIYLFYVWLLSTWIIDDAGISFAYARNLANGYGLTSWPGEKPVEGFSNFLWTILMSLLHILKIFDPILTPKIAGFVFLIIGFFLVQELFFKITNQPLWGLMANILIAANAPIVIWCNSGLENSLYIFLVLLLAYQIVFLNNTGIKQLLFIALTCFLISLTRPDGCLYFFAFPVVMLLSKEQSGSRTKQLLLYGLLLMALYGGFLCFRYAYFGDWVPNPYHVKYHELWGEKKWGDKINYLSFGIGGRWGKFLLTLIIVCIPFLKPKNKLVQRAWKTVLIIWVLGILNFFLLPADWMGELRFASIFIVFTYLILVLELYMLFTSYADRSDLKKVLVFTPVILFIIYSSYHFYIRTNDFLKDPTIPFHTVKTTYPDRWNAVNRKMGWENASILLPDVGATLYYSEIKVIDAVGLCDPTVCKKMAEGDQALRNYVFDELKPSIIHLHGRWKELYLLPIDDRLSRDYIDVTLQIPGASDEFYPFLTCDYIRKDMINDQNRRVFDSLFTECISVELTSPQTNLSRSPQ